MTVYVTIPIGSQGSASCLAPLLTLCDIGVRGIFDILCKLTNSSNYLRKGMTSMATWAPCSPMGPELWTWR